MALVAAATSGRGGVGLMRILHVTDCYLPRLGGIELHLRDLVQAQRAAGHDVRVATSTPCGDATDPAWVTRLRPAQLTDLLRRTLPDVVHAHVSVVSPLAMASIRYAAALDIPALVTVHSLWPNMLGLGPFTGTALGLARLPVRWSAVSNRAADSVAALLGPGGPRPLVLPNAIDPSFWRLEHAPVAVPTIVSVMRMVQRKRPLALARVLREVRDRVPTTVALKAVIVGDGPRHAALRRYVDRHLADWVVLPGRLDRGQIHDLYGSASVYVAPAILESFGIAALEARCAGLPVVASSRGGVGDFITPGLDGILVENDEAMIAAVTRLVTDGALLSTMTAHCRSVTPPFDWIAACTASLEAYAQAAALVSVRSTGPALARAPG